MKLNTNKCHLLMNTQDHNFLKIGNFNENNSFSENYWVIFDCKLKSSNCIENLFLKKPVRKLNVLPRRVPYMEISRRKILMNRFFKSQFNYCRLIWICCNRSLNQFDYMRNVFKSFIATRNLAMMNCLMMMNPSLFTSKYSKN